MGPRVALLASLTIAAVTSVGAFVVSVVRGGAAVAQQVAGDPTVLTWASGASGLTAVGALVYVAKLFAKGEVVAREPSSVETKLLGLVEQSLAREEAVADLVEAAHVREERLWTVIAASQQPTTSRPRPGTG